MTGMSAHFNLFILFICVCVCEASPDRRFSDLKRCADDECSMLLCRGKASKDFSGPDCRFLSFKTGETIYVYYKLSGQRSNVWAGSVGNSFGYFPKDFLNINHIYTEKEVELPAEQTDFVCFDTGQDKFESYDVDVLLRNAFINKHDEPPSEETEEMSHSVDAAEDGVTEETSSVNSDSPHAESNDELDIDAEEDDDLRESTQASGENNKESYIDSEDIKNSPDGDSDLVQDEDKEIPDEPSPKDDGVLEKSEHVTPIEVSAALETTLGTTFDVVTSDDENTQKVTPYDDDDNEDEDHSNDVAEQSSDVAEERVKEPSLLTFEEEPRYTQDSIPDEVKSGEQKEVSPSEVSPKASETEETSSIDSVSSHTVNDNALKIDDDDDDLRESDMAQLSSETSYEQDTEAYGVKNSKTENKDMADEPSPNDDGVLEKSEHTTQVEAASALKTTLGTTFDAVTSDNENTQKVTPDDVDDDDDDEEEQNNEQPDAEEKHVKEPLLLNFEDEPNHLENSAPDANDSEDKHDSSASVAAEKDDNMWSSLGDTVFKIVSGGERTESLEDEDDDDEDDQEEEEEEGQEDPDTKTTQKDSNEFQTDLVPDSELSDSINDSVMESLHAAEVQEQNTNILNYEESPEIKSLDLEEPRNDNVEPETDPEISPLEDSKQVLDNPIESFTEKKHSDIPSEEEFSKSEEGFLGVPELDKQTDEQIDQVKHEIINLFEETLKSEHNTKLEVEEEDDEELLEDENAVLAYKTEETEESIEKTKLESQLEEDELATQHDSVPEQANKSTSEDTKHDGKSDVGPSLDVSDSLPDNDKENDRKSVDGNETWKDSVISEEPVYSDSVLRLTLLRGHFKDEEMDRILRHLSIKDLYRVEEMFAEFDHQLKSTTQSYPENSESLEHELERIAEASENAILDEIDRLLDAREQRALVLGQQIDPVMIDEEAAVLDDFQEFAFHLHLKYSARVPLVTENQSHFETAENVPEEVESPAENIPLTESIETPEVHVEDSDLLSVNDQDGASHSQDVGPGDDGGRFNKNEDAQSAFQDTAEMQRGPQAILENPLDMLGFDLAQSSDSLDSSGASDFSDKNYDQASSSVSEHTQEFILLASEYLGVYSEILIAALPKEWQPGPSFHGLPWKPVIVTAVVGALTMLVFMWRTVLAVKNRTYLLSEKQLADRIQQLVTEKSDVLRKVTELNNAIKQYEEKLNNSEESRSSLQKEFTDLKTHYQDLNTQKDKLCVNFSHLCEKIANTQEENKTLNEKISTMHQGIKKYQKTLKVYDEERSKVQVLMDEAKLREDALKAQVLSFEKDNSTLKDQKKSLLQDAKNWQEKHEKLSEEIKAYHKTQSELENALVHKENEIEVLSGCIAELKSLEACNDTELQSDKNGDPLKMHLKQMMDVSRIKTTLSVIEDERNRWYENFMTEQKARQELEEKFQKAMHDQTNVKNEKTHLENQYKNLQQRLEITTELYHQKENILHQKLTQEELERHEKETKLSEVDGRALQAEEELHSLRQKVKDMQEEMQQNERSLKSEIAVQEKKAHENWLKARASERALIEERRECANLRQKIVECSDKMSDLEHTLYKSGPPERHLPPPQTGDSYGTSPVSGGAPSPPIMMEDPGRPPSGRRSETFGPRLLLDGHVRSSADLGHPLPFRPEMSVPRTSSPCTQDGSQMVPIDVKAEVTMQTSSDPAEATSKSQRQGSFLPSPIRDSPVPGSNALPKSYGPQPVGGPLPPLNGPLPPVMRPPNGHSPMIPPGPPFGPDTFRPPHMDSFRPPFPLRPYGPIPPPFVHGPPLRDFTPMGPHPGRGIHDFPPNFVGSQDLPFPPRPFPSSGPLPPPGVMVPPLHGARGPAPPTLLQPRDGQDMAPVTGAAPEQRVAHDAPAVTQS